MHYNEAAGSASEQSFWQEIEVMNRADGLYIRHHFNGLSDARTEIIWPEESVKRACYMEDADACSRLDENTTVFVEGAEESQSISYVIPKQDAMGGKMLYKDTFATLYSTLPSSTIIHLTDELNLGGMWINGLELVGRKQMDRIDYSLFQGQGVVTDLYWQQVEHLLLYENDRLTVYGNHLDVTTEQFEEMTGALAAIGALHSTIVFDQANGMIDSDRFTITNQSNLEQVVEALLINNLYHQYALPSDERWTVEVIASLLSGKALGSEIARNAYDQLHETLSAAEIEQLTVALHENEEDVLNANLLTGMFEKTTGFGTSFFENNRQAIDKLYPLLLEDKSDIYIAGEKELTKGVILKEGQRLYPGVEIMRGLGFDVTWNEQSLYMESAKKSYRFPLKEKFYVFNERRYDVFSIPFERIGDEFYFEESAFIRIFKVEIEKLENKIAIHPIALSDKGKS